MKPRTAFTLVEILIVVIILAIIAAIVIPRFSNVSASARASMMADDLRVMRCQLNVFKAQHRGVSAGYPNCDTSQAPTEAAFVAHITMVSNENGQTAAIGTPGYEYGPYMREVPPNPLNGKCTVEVIADDANMPSAGDDSHGWIYQPSTLTFLADSAGADEYGQAYINY